MRTLFLSTSTNETDKYRDCLQALGFGETAILRYDPPSLGDETLYAQVRDWKPDLMVYIGARWGKMPGMACLATINSKVAPLVHLCSDAADNPWHDLLREYHNAGCFSLQVAIDGSRKWPLAASQMTELTPVDLAFFPDKPKPHAERAIVCGYAGNPGSGPGSKRTEILSGLLAHRGLIDLRIRSNLPHTYEAYCVYLGSVRLSVNISYTGTEMSKHVKGRVVESALAGCCLLETAGTPTSDWFRPGLDYLEYASIEQLHDIIRRLANEPEATQAIADSMRARVLAHHTPAHFWTRIFQRLGLKTEVTPLATGTDAA